MHLYHGIKGHKNIQVYIPSDERSRGPLKYLKIVRAVALTRSILYCHLYYMCVTPATIVGLFISRFSRFWPSYDVRTEKHFCETCQAIDHLIPWRPKYLLLQRDRRKFAKHRQFSYLEPSWVGETRFVLRFERTTRAFIRHQRRIQGSDFWESLRAIYSVAKWTSSSVLGGASRPCPR